MVRRATQSEIEVTQHRRAAPPRPFERTIYPEGALPLPEVYERLEQLLADAENPDAFLDPFLRGDLVIKVYDRERNRVFALKPDQIEDYISLHLSADLLFVREVVADLSEGPLSDIEGLAPYVEESEFERFLPTLRRPKSAGRKPSYDWPAFEAKAVAFLEERGNIDVEVEPEWNLAALEREMRSWCERVWGTAPVESTVRKRVSVARSLFVLNRAKADN